MALPANISVTFDYSSGATFGNPFIIGSDLYGIIGISGLGSSTNPSPTYDLTPNTTSIRIKRGRNILSDSYEVGTAKIVVNDPDSVFNPQNASSPLFGFLNPLSKIQVTATVNGFGYFLGSFYTTAYNYTYPQGQEIGYVTIDCADAFRLFNMAGVTTVVGAVNGQDTGTRINKILDQMNFPTDMRVIDTGNSICQVDPGTLRSGLSAIKNAEFSEQGAFYMGSNGAAIFKSRTNVINSLSNTAIAFNQTGGIPYSNLVYSFDDKLIVNNSTMTRVGGTPQVANSPDSIIQYFPHELNQSDLVIQTDAEALNIARIYVATRDRTTIRIDAMTVDLLDSAVPTQTMLDLDFFDPLVITNIQPNGSTIVKTLQCQGLEWSITPSTIKVTVTTLEPIVEGFIISSPISGIIGISHLAW